MASCSGWMGRRTTATWPKTCLVSIKASGNCSLTVAATSGWWPTWAATSRSIRRCGDGGRRRVAQRDVFLPAGELVAALQDNHADRSHAAMNRHVGVVACTVEEMVFDGKP